MKKMFTRLFKSPAVHMGPHQNEMCDHYVELTSDCWACELGINDRWTAKDTIQTLIMILVTLAVTAPYVYFMVSL